MFVSSCKQAKYLYEVFRRMRPGVPLCALHGRIKQTKRIFVYHDFVRLVSEPLRIRCGSQ